MALTYSLVTDAEKEPADLIRWMEATQSLHPVPGEKHTIAKPGLRCSVIPQSRTGSELIQETFGIIPGLSACARSISSIYTKPAWIICCGSPLDY